MTSYALQTPPRAAHAKPPSPKDVLIRAYCQLIWPKYWPNRLIGITDDRYRDWPKIKIASTYYYQLKYLYRSKPSARNTLKGDTK